MTTLHMEVDLAHSTQKTITDTHGQLLSMLSSMSSTVGSLQQGGWMGNSATEFFGEYDQWRSTMTNLLENLSQLSGRLQNEITEWETAAAKLS